MANNWNKNTFPLTIGSILVSVLILYCLFSHTATYNVLSNKSCLCPCFLLPRCILLPTTAVDPTKGSKLNPLYSILSEYDEDDFIVIKLDVDTASVELPLVEQMLQDDAISSKIDHLYFEHHVFLGELANSWARSMQGTTKESLELFQNLRKKGIVSHFWV